MSGARRAAWAEIRGSWRALVLLGAVLAVVAGAALASLAGARRTDTAVERYFGPGTSAADFNINMPPDPDLQAEVIEAIEEIPGVQGAARATYFVSMHEGWSLDEGPPPITPLAAVDPEWSRSIDQVRIITGRAADQERADEATISKTAAKLVGVDVGDEITLLGWSAEQAEAFETGEIFPPGAVRSTFRIVGITADELISDDGNTMYLTAAWFNEVGTSAMHFGPGLSVRVGDREAALPHLQRVVTEVMDGSPEDVEDAMVRAVTIGRSSRVQAVALLAFALVAGLLGAVVTGQAVARQDIPLAGTLRSLSALGLRRRDLIVVPLARVAAVVGFGMVGGLLLATLASGAFPLGTVRRAEPFPGITFDASVLLPGAVALTAIVVLTAVPGLVRAVRLATIEGAADVPATGDARRWPSWLGAAPRVGVAMALDPGQGRAAIPVRSVLAGVVIGVMAVTAAAVFTHNLTRLGNEPERYGWNVDLVLGSDDNRGIEASYTETIENAAWVGDWRGAGVVNAQVGGTEIPIFGFGDGRGLVVPPIIEGRAPQSDTEIALGREDMVAIGASIGDEIELQPVGDSGFATEVTIVGMSVLPTGLNSPGGLGHGGVGTRGLTTRLDTTSEINQFFVRLAPGFTVDDAMAELGDGAAEAVLPEASEDILNVERVRGVPAAIAGVLALVAFGSLAHALLTGVRRRRADLAILRSLGFVGRQVVATTVAQATTLALLALVVGVPAGIVAGRAAWGLVARSLGVADDAGVALFAIAVAAPLFVLVAWLISLAAGASARRIAPAAVLRVE